MGLISKILGDKQHSGTQAANLVAGAIWGLNPGRKYVIGLDLHTITMEDAHEVAIRLEEMGVDNVLVGFYGDPQGALKVIKAEGRLSQRTATSRKPRATSKNATKGNGR